MTEGWKYSVMTIHLLNWELLTFSYLHGVPSLLDKESYTYSYTL